MSKLAGSPVRNGKQPHLMGSPNKQSRRSGESVGAWSSPTATATRSSRSTHLVMDDELDDVVAAYENAVRNSPLRASTARRLSSRYTAQEVFKAWARFTKASHKYFDQADWHFDFYAKSRFFRTMRTLIKIRRTVAKVKLVDTGA
jgi:hypothetical protein